MNQYGKISRSEQREKVKNTYHNLDDTGLIYIPAKRELPIPENAPKKRVAAYCRVSTDNVEQASSFEMQKLYYEKEIKKNGDWEFAGIYADEGISGTSTKHRDGLNRMIADCEAGKIDLILTKSISRFTRNAADCLILSRKLKTLPNPVGIKFETENINTLDNTSEMILIVMAASAQEESRVKRDIMLWSLEKRFNNGKFLTPVLLGYDHDENGSLVINEDEARTVRFIYYLYLTGKSIPEIANILMEAKRTTKLGKTKWSANTVRAVMQNERHCGNVLSWKTYTYDFWEHKKKKNQQDMPQVLKVDHHKPIVSHEVFEAAQVKLESEKYARKGMPLPSLDVIEAGVLKGFVPVNRMWRGFSGNDYCEASQSVYDMRHCDEECELSNTFTLNGYEIVRSQFFSTREKPQLTIAKGQVRFNSVCLKKFESVEYVELLFNSVEKCLAVRPCAADKPTAIRWGRLKDSRWIVSTKSCSGFSGALYSVMDWKADCGYKLCGQYISDGNEQMLLFDLSDPEITEFEKDTVVDMAKSNDGKVNEKEKVVYHKNMVIPDSWKTSFGRSSNIIRFEFIHDKDNWEVMRPASVFRMCGNITDNIMRRVHSEIDTLTAEFLKETERKLVADGNVY